MFWFLAFAETAEKPLAVPTIVRHHLLECLAQLGLAEANLHFLQLLETFLIEFLVLILGGGLCGHRFGPFCKAGLRHCYEIYRQEDTTWIGSTRTVRHLWPKRSEVSNKDVHVDHPAWLVH